MVDLRAVIEARRRLGLPPGPEDEEFTLAVRRFQMEQRLLVTGRLDDETFLRLRDVRLLQPDTRKPRG